MIVLISYYSQIIFLVLENYSEHEKTPLTIDIEWGFMCVVSRLFTSYDLVLTKN